MHTRLKRASGVRGSPLAHKPFLPDGLVWYAKIVAITMSFPVHTSREAYWCCRANTRVGSRRNIEEHYDAGNSMYKLFLDESMTYSGAIHNPGMLCSFVYKSRQLVIEYNTMSHRA